MAWTGYVVTDKGSPNVGIAKAIWDEGEETEFIYSKRDQVSQASARILRDEAVAAHSEYLEKQIRDNNLSNILTTILNEEV